MNGFPFRWNDDLLIRRAAIFACRGLPRDRPVSVGRTASHVHFTSGPWSLAFAAVTEVRFPDVDRAIPDPGSAATRLRLDSRDAEFLAVALDRLPGADAFNAPATLDLILTTNRLHRKTYRSLQFVEEEVIERGLRAIFCQDGYRYRRRRPLEAPAELQRHDGRVSCVDVRGQRARCPRGLVRSPVGLWNNVVRLYRRADPGRALPARCRH